MQIGSFEAFLTKCPNCLSPNRAKLFTWEFGSVFKWSSNIFYFFLFYFIIKWNIIFTYLQFYCYGIQIYFFSFIINKFLKYLKIKCFSQVSYFLNLLYFLFVINLSIFFKFLDLYMIIVRFIYLFECRNRSYSV